MVVSPTPWAEGVRFVAWQGGLSQFLNEIFLQKCHESHQIDWRNVWNAKMCAGWGGGGGWINFFFNRQK